MASETLDSPIEGSTVATELAFERMGRALDVAGHHRHDYPRDAVFVPADLPDFGLVLARYLRGHKPVIVVYPDGTERMLVPGEPARGGLFLWRALRHRGWHFATKGVWRR